MGILEIYARVSQMSTYSILVVDDEPDNFDVIQSLLPGETYTLHYAMNGQQAIASLEKYDPDVILLDVMMPDISGIEVCKKIKSMSEWKSIPIVMVTALSSKEDLAMCLASGADDFVSKPVNSLELRARVNSMLRIKKQHDRIQSLSKLQRTNIHSLTHNLHEIRVDLAGGFANEFDRPLDIICDNNEHLTNNINELSFAAILHTLGQNNRSARKLQSLLRKLWFYLQIVLEKSAPSLLDISNLVSIVDRCSIDKFSGADKPITISCSVKDARLAVDPAHFEWICNESIEYIINHLNPNARLSIHGEAIGESFNISFTGSQGEEVRSSILETRKITESNPGDDRTESLEIGLKIVISTLDKDENTIYITLPLVLNETAATQYSAIGNNIII
jgi:two-component system, sensor histidine kinase and response regulator